MYINKVDNTNFKQIYKLRNTERNLAELKTFIMPTYMDISKEPVIAFAGSNPFKIGLEKLMQIIAEKNNGNVDWLKMNAKNHGINISGAGDDILTVISTKKDINNLKEYILSRLNMRKPSFTDKIKSFFGIREVSQFNTELPKHLAILEAGLKIDREEAEAFSKYVGNINIFEDAQSLFKALMSEH